MEKPRITIIGLGLIGGSIGLALTDSTKALHIVGHDIDPGQGRLAQKKGAVNESTLNLFDACQDADLVVIATPITAIRETMALIGPHLKEGCVVTDTAKLKGPVLAWAADTLPAAVAYVGGAPLLNPNARPDNIASLHGFELARADLFENALYAVCPSPQAPPTAVKRVSDMVSLLKARPFFLDPIEHDGMRAAVEGLATVASLALMKEVSGSPGWRETRKLADHVFGMVTAPLTTDASVQRAQLLLNADNLLPRLDALLQELTRLREYLAVGNAEALEDVLSQATSMRARWLADWAAAKWEEKLGEASSASTLGSLGNMLGFGMGRRRPKEE